MAKGGVEALEICQTDDPPDLVLLDVMMPGMGGIEVAQRTREHPTSETIPIIFVTAMTSQDARMKGMGLGAADCVTKPVNPDVLMHRMRNFMRYVNMQRELQSDVDDMVESARLREDVDQIKAVEEALVHVMGMDNLSAELFKIETGRFTLNAATVDVLNILRRLVEIDRATFSSKHVTISVDTDVPVGQPQPMARGDAMLCFSLFQNLLKNACEAAPVGTQVMARKTMPGSSQHDLLGDVFHMRQLLREIAFRI